MNLKKRLLINLFTLLGLCFSQEKVDSFFLYDFNDESFYFSEELKKDKPIFINFFATWCGPCLEELPNLQKLADANPEISFFIIHVDNLYQDNIKLTEPSRKEVLKILRDKEVTINKSNILYDKYAIVANKFNIFTLPRSFLLSNSGVIIDDYEMIDIKLLDKIQTKIDNL
tara:strand:- start:64 stop:576 length:513 start_codon:yes stop_codon:yes gene_type:complete